MARYPQAFAQDSTPVATPAVSYNEDGTVTLPAITAVASPDELPLKEAGKLIVHTDEPVFEPWFVDNDPANGKGFESALTYAIAAALGFSREDVTWGRTPFNSSYAPGPKPFDFYLCDVGITEKRAEAVGFSEPYHKAPLVVVAKDGSPVLEARSLSELATFSWGVQVGTTYQTYLTDYIKAENILVYDTNADGLTALENGTVDGNLQTLQIGIFVTTEQYPDMSMGGLLPDKGLGGDGLVTELDSELIPFLNSALDELYADGVIDTLVAAYMAPPTDMFTYTED